MNRTVEGRNIVHILRTTNHITGNVVYIIGIYNSATASGMYSGIYDVNSRTRDAKRSAYNRNSVCDTKIGISGIMKMYMV